MITSERERHFRQSSLSKLRYDWQALAVPWDVRRIYPATYHIKLLRVFANLTCQLCDQMQMRPLFCTPSTHPWHIPSQVHKPMCAGWEILLKIAWPCSTDLRVKCPVVMRIKWSISTVNLRQIWAIVPKTQPKAKGDMYGFDAEHSREIQTLSIKLKDRLSGLFFWLDLETLHINYCHHSPLRPCEESRNC